jgi:hypothetical protein
MPYWNFVFGSSVDELVELLGQRSKDEAELMESKLFGFTSIEINHVVVLNPSDSSKVSEVLRADIAFVSHVE